MMEEKDTSDEATPSQIASLEGVTIQNDGDEKATVQVSSEEPLTQPKYLTGWKFHLLTVG